MKVIVPLLAPVFALAVSACSSVSLDAPAETTDKGSKVEWEPAPQGSGYYLDDGPGSHRPKNLHALPDAVPKLEPIAPANTRTYTVMGLTFTPQKTLEEPYRQEGRASWYGRKFHGAKTANGEIYDMYQMTAAHPTLPLPSYARVTNLDNGKSVIVRVNDRGPFLRGRIIDLSYAAALKLGYINQGSARVRVEKFTPEAIAAFKPEVPSEGVDANQEVASSIPINEGAEVRGAVSSGVFDQARSVPLEESAMVADAVPVSLKADATVQAVAVPTDEIDSNQIPATPQIAAKPEVASVSDSPQATTAATAAQAASGFYLQLGAFGLKANAQALAEKVSYVSLASNPEAKVKESTGLFKVFVGPFIDVAAAQEASKLVNQALNIKPIVFEGLIQP